MTDIAVAILAAGQSRRFGPVDKLAAPFRGKPVGLHMSDRIASLGPMFAKKWVVAPNCCHPCVEGWRAAGWSLIENPRAETGMGSSVALAASEAARTSMRALMICLADMPLVPEQHILAMCLRMSAFEPGDLLVTSDGERRLPPVAFSAAHYATLRCLDGDIGARALIDKGESLQCDPSLLIDIDDAETLKRLG